MGWQARKQAELALKNLIALCYREPMVRRLIALALELAFATAGQAQMLRQLPASAKLGDLVGRQQPFPLLQINNQVARLAPGGLIYDENNRTILHGVLPERAYVLYLQEANGDVTRVYILRPEELEIVKRARGL